MKTAKGPPGGYPNVSVISAATCLWSGVHASSETGGKRGGGGSAALQGSPSEIAKLKAANAPDILDMIFLVMNAALLMLGTLTIFTATCMTESREI